MQYNYITKLYFLRHEPDFIDPLRARDPKLYDTQRILLSVFYSALSLVEFLFERSKHCYKISVHHTRIPERVFQIQSHLSSIAIVENIARFYETLSRRKYERSIHNSIRPSENSESYCELFHESSDILPFQICLHKSIDIRIWFCIRKNNIIRELGSDQAKAIASYEPSFIYCDFCHHRAYACGRHVGTENVYLSGGDHMKNR